MALAIAVWTWIGSSAQAQPGGCGPLQNAFGPFDYRTERGNNLYLVESAHFTPVVEALVSGATTRAPGSDLDYTLRAYPNHHRALLSVMQYGERQRSPQPTGLRYPVECYFERALRFRSDDTTARMIYALFLRQSKRLPEAEAQLDAASAQALDNAFTHYNLGMSYLELGLHQKALQQAHRAQALGFTRTELADRLKAQGHWTDPSTDATATEPAASPASQ